MRLIILLAVFLVVTGATAQTLNYNQQSALNDFVYLINESGKDASTLVAWSARYYEQIIESKQSRYTRPRFQYDFQPRPYAIETARKNAAKLGANSQTLATKANALWNALLAIDKKAKELDTYQKLEDYKQDNYANGSKLALELITLHTQYRAREQELADEIRKVYRKLQVYTASNPYHKAEQLMRDVIDSERKLITQWSYSLLKDSLTSWPMESLVAAYLNNERQLELLLRSKPKMVFQAEHGYNYFIDMLRDAMKSKQYLIDEANWNKRLTDEHRNYIYEQLLNQFNGALVPAFAVYTNTFQYTNTYFVSETRISPLYELRTETLKRDYTIKPCALQNYGVLDVTVQKAAITKHQQQAIDATVQYLDEVTRKLFHFQISLANLNGSAARLKDQPTLKGKGSLHFSIDDFKLPVSYSVRAVAMTEHLPASHAAFAKSKLEELISISNEIEFIAANLQRDTKNKSYETDNLNVLYAYFNRLEFLFTALDERKEKLYEHMANLFYAFPPTQPTNAWYVSTQALYELIKENKKQLFAAKPYFLGDTTTKINTEKIHQLVRKVIAEEYDNLNGLKKYGPNNGLDPNYRYERIPTGSKSFAEKLTADMVPAKVKRINRGPYEGIIYAYNSLVHDFNEFTELGNVPLLRCIAQLGIYKVQQPDPPKPEPVREPVVAQTPVALPVETSVVEEAPEQVTTVDKKPKRKKDKPVTTESAATVNEPTGRVIHDTVRVTDIIRIETIRQDTVYIEKRDTVYVSTKDENFLSMEGYATNNMVLLLDVSGSMNQPDKLPLLKKSVLLLLKMMREEDQVSIVIYSGKAKVLLPPTSFKDEEKITKAINSLKSEGKTDGNAGIKTAYQVADKNYIRGGNNRIILATDGEFPVSADTYSMIEEFAGQDIFLSVFNFGKSTVSGKNLQKIAALGRGNYEYITRENVDAKLVREAKSKRKK